VPEAIAKGRPIEPNLQTGAVSGLTPAELNTASIKWGKKP